MTLLASISGMILGVMSVTISWTTLGNVPGYALRKYSIYTCTKYFQKTAFHFIEIRVIYCITMLTVTYMLAMKGRFHSL